MWSIRFQLGFTIFIAKAKNKVIYTFKLAEVDISKINPKSEVG